MPRRPRGAGVRKARSHEARRFRPIPGPRPATLEAACGSRTRSHLVTSEACARRLAAKVISIWSRSRDSNPLLRSTKAPCDPSYPSGTPEAGLPSRSRRRRLERETGFEPVSRTRQVRALPLSYTRSIPSLSPRPGNKPPGEARAALRKLRPVCRLRSLSGLFTPRIRNGIHCAPRCSKSISCRAQNKKAFLGRSQEGFSQAAAM